MKKFPICLMALPSALAAVGVAVALGYAAPATAQAKLVSTPALPAYGQTVAAFGQALSTLNTQVGDQQTIENMFLTQRDSIGGVSLDEEITDLTRYQKAFAASARLITTVDEMLETVVNLKR